MKASLRLWFLCKTLSRYYNVNSSKDLEHIGFAICKNILFFPVIWLIVPFLAVTCRFSNWKLCKTQNPKTMCKSISVQANATVGLFQIFGLILSYFWSWQSSWEPIIIPACLVICLFTSCDNNLGRKCDMWDSRNCSALYFLSRFWKPTVSHCIWD